MNPFKPWPRRPFQSRCVSSSLLPFLLATVLLPPAALGQLGQRGPSRPVLPDDGAELADGVVAAPRLGVVYLMRPGGGIDAVELASGTVRWHSDRAAKPIAVADDRLVAQARSRSEGALDLVVLDARSGTPRDAVRLPLPAGIAASVIDTPAGSFRVRADRSGSQLTVHWQATTKTSEIPAQGYLPVADEGQAPTVVAGQATIGLGEKSLRLEREPAVRSVAPPRPRLEELASPAVPSSEGRQFLSADGRHVLVSEPLDASGFALNPHQWTVYERVSGTRLGSVAAPVAAAPFLVVGTTLYHATPVQVLLQAGDVVEYPASLRSVDLATGAEMWKAAIQETTYKGPFPP